MEEYINIKFSFTENSKDRLTFNEFIQSQYREIIILYHLLLCSDEKIDL